MRNPTKTGKNTRNQSVLPKTTHLSPHPGNDNHQMDGGETIITTTIAIELRCLLFNLKWRTREHLWHVFEIWRVRLASRSTTPAKTLLAIRNPEFQIRKIEDRNLDRD